MKKNKLFAALLTLFMLYPWVGWGQGLEDFTNSNATSSYGNNSFVGNDGITWTYVASRDENGDANGSGIDGKALMLRRNSDNSAVTSSAISGGIGNFSVKLYKGFTGGGDRQVELFINDISQGLSTPFDDFAEHIFEVNGINTSGDVVIKITNATSKQVIVDNIEWTAYNSGTPVVATPLFTPAGGNYYSTQSVSISTSTPDATIYYTTDGSDPDNTSTEYTIPISVSTNQTLKARAYASGYDPSAIGSASYTFPVVNDVANIAALRAGLTDGTTYRLLGEAVLTYQTSVRNAKYIQDASGAILIDDPAGKIGTVYSIYDGITGIIGTLGLYQNMLQFTPVADPGTASSSGNAIVPEEVTLAELEPAYQAKLVKILNTTITETGNFAVSTNYNLTDASGTGILRTQYSDLDYIGTAIPVTSLNITGMVLQFGSIMQFIPRSLTDFEAGSSPALVTNPTTLSGFAYSEGNGPSASQAYDLSGSQLTGFPGVIAVSGSSSFEVSSDDITFGTTAGIPYSAATLTATPVYVRMKAGLAAGSYTVEAITNSGGGALAAAEVLCSGSVLSAEPSNHVANFMAESVTASTIPLTWTDAIGGVLPAAYLIKGSVVSFDDINAPTDGTPEANGALIHNVDFGMENYTFTGLTPETPYFFKIFPYTNEGTSIDFKTDGSIPEVMASTTAIPAGALVYESFDYPVGEALQTQLGWTAVNSGDDIVVADGNLSYAGLQASQGQKIAFAGAGIDAYKTFVPQTSNTVYYSFIMKVTDLGSLNATGGYFTGLASNGTTFGATVWTGLDGEGYKIGINPRTSTTTNMIWIDGTQTLNDEVLVVVSYEFVEATGNDIVKIWVNPGASSLGSTTPPEASAIVTNTEGTDLTQISQFFIRQDSNTETPFLEMDECRVGLSWADVTPTGDANKMLNLQVLLEALYDENGSMREALDENGAHFEAGIADVINVELHDAANYENKIANIGGVQLAVDGNASLQVPATFDGEYYVTVRHRNSVEITSAGPISFSGSTINVNFLNPAQVYGSNLGISNDGYYFIFAGDINQDGVVDTGDMTLVDNDAATFASGYLTTDANGDGVVDTSDMTLIENNAANFIKAVLP
ncbi:MAG: chitobiase/beta-hexosaminidase C-terminal domain-containing protein [Lentimicrobium sp.]|jgi:hypothetical protein|nr:chitobiase/beta-hexosaminidase C-terminal domain-containing protein [Lentimicrobium sp.]